MPFVLTRPDYPQRPDPSGRRASEDGYILVLVMFMLALLIIGMAVALPKMATEIQRDKEIETYHRGMQYRRAVQLYYRKFQRYPPNLDALVKTNDIRFLRKKYIDPMTGKDDWKPIMFGQNKTPMAMGFFGQPMGGFGAGAMPIAGTGPSGGNGIGMGTSSFGSNGSMGNSSFGGNSSIGNSTFGGNSSIGGSTFGGNTGGSIFGNANNGTSATGSNQTDANGNPVDPNTGSTALGSGPTFGGAGIIGFSPASPKLALFVYKKKNHYNEWEFLYSPLSDQMMMGGGNMGTIQPSTPGVGAPGTGFSPTGSPTTGVGTIGPGSNPGTGTTDGSAGSGTTPTTPTQPQP